MWMSLNDQVQSSRTKYTFKRRITQKLNFTSNSYIYKIKKIQKKASRYITRDFASSYSKLLNVRNKNKLIIYY